MGIRDDMKLIPFSKSLFIISHSFSSHPILSRSLTLHSFLLVRIWGQRMGWKEEIEGIVNESKGMIKEKQWKL